MPNISLQPNPHPTSLTDLISGVDRGIYIVGAGSWSIDQQRDNGAYDPWAVHAAGDARLT